MKAMIELPDYDGNALDVTWAADAKCSISVYDNMILLKADADGLISLAKQMLYMAYNKLPAGSHVHYDDYFLSGSQYELILEKDTG